MAAASYVTQSLITKFYNSNVGVPLTTISLASLLAGVVASYVQLGTGYLSDRTHWKFGRRRPYILVAGPLMGVVLFLLLSPPASAAAAGTWYVIFYMLWVILSDVINVTYQSLGTELTVVDKERNNVFVSVAVAVMLGVMGTAMAQGAVAKHMSERHMFMGIGLVVGIAMAVMYPNTVAHTREDPEYAARTSFPLVPGARACAKNKQWLIYLLGNSTLSLMNEITGLFAFVLQDIYHLDPDTHMSSLVMVYGLSNALATLACMFALRYFSKLTVLRFTLVFLVLYGVAGYFCMVGAATRTVGPFAGSLALFGASLAGLNVVSPILLSDCVDYDELYTGKRRESTYVSISGLPSKVATVAGRALPLMCLHMAGYRGGSTTAQQPEAALFVMRFFVTIFPGILAVIGLCVFAFYRIDERMHEAIVAAVRRAHAVTSSDAESGGAAGAAFVKDPLTGNMVSLMSRVASARRLSVASASSGAVNAPVDVKLVDGTVAGNIEAIEESEANSPITMLMYFSKREAALLLRGWQKRIVAHWGVSLALWALWAVLAVTAGLKLRSKGGDNNDNAAFLAVSVGAIFSIIAAYELVRYKGIRWLGANTKANVSDALRQSRAQAPVVDKDAAEVGSGAASELPQASSDPVESSGGLLYGAGGVSGPGAGAASASGADAGSPTVDVAGTAVMDGKAMDGRSSLRTALTEASRFVVVHGVPAALVVVLWLAV